MEVIPDESTSWRLFQKPDVFDGDYSRNLLYLMEVIPDECT
jgi:hypothetical protein